MLGVPVFADLSLPAGAGATLDRGFLAQRRFEGQPGQAQAVLADDGSTVVALGVGPRDRLDADVLRRAGAALARQAGTASEVATTLAAAAPRPELVAAAVEGIGLGAYRFEGARKAPRPGRLERVLMVGPGSGRNGVTTASGGGRGPFRSGRGRRHLAGPGLGEPSAPGPDAHRAGPGGDRRRRGHGRHGGSMGSAPHRGGAARGLAGGRRRGVRAAVRSCACPTSRPTRRRAWPWWARASPSIPAGCP